MESTPLEKLVTAIDILTRSSCIYGYVLTARDCAPPERHDAGEGWILADMREDAESAAGDCKGDC